MLLSGLFIFFLAGLLLFLSPVSIPFAMHYQWMFEGLRRARKDGGRFNTLSMSLSLGMSASLVLFLTAFSALSRLSGYSVHVWMLRVAGLEAVVLGVFISKAIDPSIFGFTLTQSKEEGSEMQHFIIGASYALGMGLLIWAMNYIVAVYEPGIGLAGLGQTIALSLGISLPYLFLGSLVRGFQSNPLSDPAALVIRGAYGLLLLGLGVLLISGQISYLRSLPFPTRSGLGGIVFR